MGLYPWQLLGSILSSKCTCTKSLLQEWKELANWGWHPDTKVEKLAMFNYRFCWWTLTWTLIQWTPFPLSTVFLRGETAQPPNLRLSIPRWYCRRRSSLMWNLHGGFGGNLNRSWNQGLLSQNGATSRTCASRFITFWTTKNRGKAQSRWSDHSELRASTLTVWMDFDHFTSVCNWEFYLLVNSLLLDFGI